MDLDDNNVPIPGSFDASTLEDAENKNVRLIMRQDSTHRLLLNTVLIPAMSFQEKPTNKTVCVLFTAIEDKGEPVSIQLKVSTLSYEIRHTPCVIALTHGLVQSRQRQKLLERSGKDST